MAAALDPALDAFHPIVRQWFAETLGAPSPPQRAGWPAIANGGHTLILAPTGTGKTLTAFLWELDALIKEGVDEPLPNAVHLLYVSPLKALSNDIQKNLERPLAELATRFAAAGEHFPDIRVAVRTGDTPASARARMIRRTPHILITTPESLHLLLTSAGGRSMFSSLRAVIIDEIHAVAGTKRGVHLALTLERLRPVAGREPQRIGLSATQRPLEEIARFLGGCEPRTGDGDAVWRPVQVVDCGLVKTMDARIVSPVDDLAHVDGSVWFSVVPLVLKYIREARTTLVFVNNRGQAERIAARVNAQAEEELALPYHGSLSRERRFLLEERLKAGNLRALVTTSSLELGIDIGSVDLVVQLQSPKRVAAALQRIGRSGHSLGATSRGVMIPTFRDDALELLTIEAAMAQGDVEPTEVVQNALDVLAQLIVAIVASEEPEWRATALFAFVRQAYPYHRLTRNAFDETLEMLAGKYPADVTAELDARLNWNRSTDVLTPSRSARLVATISGGTIPDRGLYGVYLPDRTRLGELDEEFVHESRVNDVFQLGSSTWRIESIEPDRVMVIPAPGAPARLPFWHGEFMARSYHLTPRVGELRRRLAAADAPEDVDAIAADYHADRATVASVVEYVHAQRAAVGVVPDERHLVLEHFRDDVGSVRMVLHAPFGGRVNAPWGMALARRMRERLGTDVQVLATDNGILFRLPNLGIAPPTDVVRAIGPEEGEQLLLEEVGSSALFGAHFRMNAGRALLLPRGNPRRRMPLWLQRLKSADLLESVRRYPAFPILVETYRDVLRDTFDHAGLRTVLTDLAMGRIELRVVESTAASPFAQAIQFGFVMDWMYGDDAPRAESRATLLSLDRTMLDELLGGAGADEATLTVLGEILARRRGTAPERQARDADELAILLHRAGDLTAVELATRIAPAAEWRRGNPFDELLREGRAQQVMVHDEMRYVTTDLLPRYEAAFADGELADAARHEILTSFVMLAGPVGVSDAVARYGFDAEWVERCLTDWEARDMLVRGVFGGNAATVRWCARRLLEQARRRELARARQQIQAVDLSAFAAFMSRWQHLAPGSRLAGDGAPLEALTQLFGAPRPPSGWEREYLPARLEPAGSDALEVAVTSGRVAWAMTPNAAGSAQLRFFPRGTGRLWVAPLADELPLSDRAIAVRDFIRDNGASFTEEIEAALTLGDFRLGDALRELVLAGVLTNDSVAALREVIAWTPALPAAPPGVPADSGRWLPEGFSSQRPTSRRRVGRWKRPDRGGVVLGPSRWPGRWALVHTPGLMGRSLSIEEDAAAVARQWLARYGIVSRDWWRREHPAVEWRAIYHELKRLEFRGDVRRGYFVAGLAGAQFALPEAVELLRSDERQPAVVLAASDPANVYALPLGWGYERDPFARARGAGALLVIVGGVVVVTAEGAGKRISIRDGIAVDDTPAALRALVAHRARRARGRARDLLVETINGAPALTSPLAPLLVELGFRRQPGGLALPRD